MTIQDAIAEYVRTLGADPLQSRWKNPELLTFFRIACRRANALGVRNELVFMRTSVEIPLMSGAASFPLPADFYTPLSLWNGSREIKMVSVKEYEREQATSPLCYWLIDGNLGKLKGSASGDTTVKLWYFMDVKAESLLLSSQSPWDDRLTMMCAQYAVMRLQNVDEMNISQDARLLADFEDQILSAYDTLSPEMDNAVGVFTL